jgi:uncharacterized protein involved in exopolysaccharide biosynthesis
MRDDYPAHDPRDPDMFDARASLLRLYRAARREWKVVLLTCAVVLAVATAYALYWPPIYRAEVTLMSEGERDVARDAFYTAWSVFRKDDLRTETELFTSAPVLKEVIRRENLTYDDIYHPFISHVSYLWQLSLPGRAWRSFKEWLSPPDADAPSAEEQDRARTLSDMKAGIVTAQVGEANIGTVTVNGPTRRVSDVANTLIAVYFEQRLERYKSEAMKSISSLSEEVDASAAVLRKIEDDRKAFMEKNGLAVGIEKEKLEVTKLSDLEDKVAETKAKLAAMEASLAEIQRQIKNEPATRTITTSFELNGLREATKMKRLEQQTALIGARSRYREDSPEVQEILSNIASLDAMIAETSEKVAKSSTDALNSSRDELRTRENGLRTEVAGLRAALSAMEKRSTQLQARMAAVPALETQLQVFDREHKFAQEKYLTLFGKREQAAVSMAGLRAMPSIRIVSDAVRPDKKFWPKNLILFPAALFAGLVLGLAIALVKTILVGRIRREHLAEGRDSAQFFGVVRIPTKAPPFEVVAPERSGQRASS